MESIAPPTRSEPGSPIISGNRIPQAIFKSIAPPNTSNPSEPMQTNIKVGCFTLILVDFPLFI